MIKLNNSSFEFIHHFMNADDGAIIDSTIVVKIK